jgi:hypothetical protein
MSEMKCICRNNYLHYGEALTALKTIDLSEFQMEEIYKKELLDFFAEKGINNKYLEEIILAFGTKRKRKIRILQLKNEIENSLKFQKEFKNLHCRGFSYYFFDKMQGFPFLLKKEINLRLALMSNDVLFYPPKVKKYLSSITGNHYSMNNYPSIGFALGSIIENDFYIFTIQSDLAFHTPTYVKEHFRGWRKILFYNIIKYAIRKKAENIFVLPADEVYRTCHPKYRKPKKLPYFWKIFYDETSKSFNMKLIRMNKTVNIQIYSRQPKIHTDRFFKLSLKNISQSEGI